jgi:spore coat protein JB
MKYEGGRFMTQTLCAKSIQIMKEMQTCDYALLELTLHLDAHPADLEALKQYNTLAEHRKGVKDKVSLRRIDGTPTGDNWQLNADPLPWQI